MNAGRLEMLVNASLSPEVHLPEAKPLTLTRNFAWVVVFCVGSLLTVPVAIGWMASLMLK